MNLLALFVWAVQIHNVTPVIHTLNYFTTVSQVAKLPEFLEVAYVDGVQILQFDSNRRATKAKHDWVNKITEDNPYFWEIETVINIQNEQIMKDNIETAKKRFNQTGGVHMIQMIQGCEWDDETDEVDGWERVRYDGEDFLAFEAKTMTWIAAHPQAFITKIKLDQRDGENQIRKTTYTKMCPVLLKTHLRNGRDFLTRTELPKVSLLQKTPCSPVTCHATGFYTRTSTLFWRKNGEEIHEDVEMGETLPNHDGTFQTSAHLKVEVTPAAEREYECVFRLAGGPEDIVIKLDAGSILSNQEQHWKNAVAIAVPLVVLNLVAMVMAVVVVAMILDKHLKRKNVIYSQACKEEKPKTKEEEEEGQLSVGILSEHCRIAPDLEIQMFFLQVNNNYVSLKFQLITYNLKTMAGPSGKSLVYSLWFCAIK
ncbi:H-2 class I histocompatibility antigen, K-Q alpha chain isoform X1 [Syngnathus scovelli]|uniref:H-2 class I histocompatibility antigen, K-Q alpha chain isoform X1 n=1 Tax=Syngnathus scovelli TaxID=161590 RepID=UPI0021102B42|nr:H-2 class I histocompatibility antigen, K-Q alpha chain isoform X2 [Syngnathus scovelli]XP_049606163.1 H-2 class I histocompatibility antigen, K-Q alpha chain isoform X3 [Syngnathus scovelli]